MPENPDALVYQLIGEDGFARLVAAFYAQIKTDNILGPLYPDHDFPGAEQRLRDFLVGRFGGPARYIAARGHPRLRMRHAPFPVDRLARDRWVQLMDDALAKTQLPPQAAAVLREFFHSTATFMINTGPTPSPQLPPTE
jgi:hemoglobin